MIYGAAADDHGDNTPFELPDGWRHMPAFETGFRRISN